MLGVLTGALAKESSQQQGAQSLSKALSEDHDGSILNNLSDYISNYQSGKWQWDTQHTLGNSRPAVERGLSQKTGLDIGLIWKSFNNGCTDNHGNTGKDPKTERP